MQQENPVEFPSFPHVIDPCCVIISFQSFKERALGFGKRNTEWGAIGVLRIGNWV